MTERLGLAFVGMLFSGAGVSFTLIGCYMVLTAMGIIDHYSTQPTGGTEG
ncbi:MAG: hypothetical protein AAGA08_16950 [Pseudomonadota bacterium]